MRQKLFSSQRPDVLYAIGDVHGCFDLLQQLNARIVADAAREPGTKWLIMLGDYVDRGPASSRVLDELLHPMGGDIHRICLAGNHEDTMLDFIANPRRDHLWLEFGGLETLRSYGIETLPPDGQPLRAAVAEAIKRPHIEFLRGLPSLLSVPDVCFVHAGLLHGVPLNQQEDRSLLWIRPSQQQRQATPNPFLTVHGHTPVRRVALVDNRLNVDTGAFMTGRLSAAKIRRDGTVTVLTAS